MPSQLILEMVSKHFDVPELRNTDVSTTDFTLMDIGCLNEVRNHELYEDIECYMYISGVERCDTCKKFFFNIDTAPPLDENFQCIRCK